MAAAVVKRPSAISLLNRRRNLNVVAIIAETTQRAHIAQCEIAICCEQSAERESIGDSLFTLLNSRPLTKDRARKGPYWALGRLADATLELEGSKVASGVASSDGGNIIVVRAPFDARPD